MIVASSVSTPPVHVKPSPVVFHILVLSSGTTYPAEILTGWQMSEACYDDPQPSEITHLNFADDHDLVVILKLLDKVRVGFFWFCHQHHPGRELDTLAQRVNHHFAPAADLGG